uniref:Uncharacterized protein n=1 Tax=Glossina pallidipes TaxID=7398 RepID=A0A1A9ZQA7_GLOPL
MDRSSLSFMVDLKKKGILKIVFFHHKINISQIEFRQTFTCKQCIKCTSTRTRSDFEKTNSLKDKTQDSTKNNSMRKNLILRQTLVQQTHIEYCACVSKILTQFNFIYMVLVFRKSSSYLVTLHNNLKRTNLMVFMQTLSYKNSMFVHLDCPIVHCIVYQT